MSDDYFDNDSFDSEYWDDDYYEKNKHLYSSGKSDGFFYSRKDGPRLGNIVLFLFILAMFAKACGA